MIEDEWYGDYDWLGKGKIKWETILLYILAGILVLFYPVKILLIKLRLLADRKIADSSHYTVLQQAS